MPPLSTRPTDRRRRTTAVVAVLVGLLLAVVLTGCSSSPATGQALPETELVDLTTGEPTSFAAYEGSPLVVNLWASWCTPCRTEMPAFERVHQQVGDAVTIVGLTDDPDLDATREAAVKTGVTYPLLVDTAGRFQSDLAITGLPATVFVGADGRVVATHTGQLDEQALLDEIGRLHDQP